MKQTTIARSPLEKQNGKRTKRQAKSTKEQKIKAIAYYTDEISYVDEIGGIVSEKIAIPFSSCCFFVSSSS